MGSAAFNILFVIGVCNWAIPKGEIRRIKRLPVFLLTSLFSIFAYIWLYLIISVITPDVIELWEALLTLVFFVITIVAAYITDRFFHIYDYLTKTYRIGRNGIIIETTTDSSISQNLADFHFKHFPEEIECQDVKQFEDHRREFIINLKNLRKFYPTMDSNQLEVMASAQIVDKGTTSRAFHRMKISKKLTGLSSSRVRQASRRTDLHNGLSDMMTTISAITKTIDHLITKVYFNPGHYTVAERIGKFRVAVVRENGDLKRKILVDFTTEDAGAIAGKDYIAAKGTLCFGPGEKRKEIELEIIDDLVYEGDQHFYVRLFNLRFALTDGRKVSTVSQDAYMLTPMVTRAKLSANSSVISTTSPNDELQVPKTIMTTDTESNEDNSEALLRLVNPSLATVLILDDDHHGIFSLVDSNVSIRETAGVYHFQIIRSNGSKGIVALSYRTEEGTAKEGRDYEHRDGILIFQEGDVE